MTRKSIFDRCFEEVNPQDSNEFGRRMFQSQSYHGLLKVVIVHLLVI